MGKITEYRRITTLTTEICFFRPLEARLSRSWAGKTAFLWNIFLWLTICLLPGLMRPQCYAVRVLSGSCEDDSQMGWRPNLTATVEVKHLLKGSVLLSSLGLCMWMCFQGSYVANIIKEMVTEHDSEVPWEGLRENGWQRLEEGKEEGSDIIRF